MEILGEWIDARSAAIFLRPCTPKHLNENVGPMLTRKTGNKPGTRTARSGGWLYHRHDLKRVRAIMDALGCKAQRAAWLFHSIKVLGERRMLPFLSKEIEANAEQERRRRFQ